MTTAVAVETKFCPHCETDVPVTEYRTRVSHGYLRPASYCKPCEKTYDRQHRKRRKSWFAVDDPVERERRMQRRRDLDRARKQALRERTLIGPLEQPWRRALKTSERYSSIPLRCWLIDYLPNPYAYEEAGRLLLVSERTVRNVFELDTVTVTVVDRIFTRLGCPDQLEVIYPLEGPHA